MHEYRVLVIGGYGFFGSRLVTRLALQPRLHIIVTGRSGDAAQALVAGLRPASMAQLSYVAMDAMAKSFREHLVQMAPDVVVHTSGPFQDQDYRVAEACAAAGAHYIDLADGRQFVAGFAALDAQARAASVLLTSGASSVPALSSAVVDYLARGMAAVRAIDIGISPGNRTERGLSTIAAILSYCGKPLPPAGPTESFGWLGSHRHNYPAPIGSRLLSPCDVPDLALLPARYARPGAVPTVRFGAGLELEFLHRGMNLMAWLARRGAVPNWSTHARWLKRAADLFVTWGSDVGGMHVSVAGTDDSDAPIERSWVLLAGSGDGPYVPTLAASALVRKLAAGAISVIGAQPCMGLVSLHDFIEETTGLDIRMAEITA